MAANLIFKNLLFEVEGVGKIRVNGGVQSSERVVLRGPSGCGKTTFLRCLAGLVKELEGEICLGDTTLSGLHTQARNVGLVFQGGALFPHLNVLENVRFGLKFGPESTHWSADLQRTRARDFLGQLGLGGLAERGVSALSGGERQRVALARALILQPHYLLIDEALSAVDEATKVQVEKWLIDRLQEIAVPTLIVTHNSAEAAALGTRIIEWQVGQTELHL